MVERHVEDGGHLPLSCAVANEPGVAARAEREGECVEQDGLAGAGLAGEHGEPSAKVRSSRSIRTMSRIERAASMAFSYAGRKARG
jgi:hypothetical protein